MCKNLLKDTRKGPTLPGVCDFYPLKVTPPSPSVAGMYLSPHDRREALLQGDAYRAPSHFYHFLWEIVFPFTTKPCGWPQPVADPARGGGGNLTTQA